jgi:outer membrane immunogenic protein
MKLKQCLLASTLCVMPFAASAADLSVKAPYSAVAPFSWTGFYIGGSGGLIMQGTTGTDLGNGFGGGFWANLGDTYGVTGNGGIFGVNAGYNYQMGNVLLGLEADIAASSLNDSFTSNGLAVGSKLSSLGTLRGRIGYAFDRALLYATGGLAYGHVENQAYNVNFPAYNANTSGMRTGWTAGGGLEYAVTNNWTVRAEALYVDLGTATGSNPIAATCRFGFKNTYTVGRFGLNYKF